MSCRYGNKVMFKTMNFDFVMAKNPKHDSILHEILKFSIKSLFSNLGEKQILGVLLTGSVANGEGTVLVADSLSIISDLDLVVYLDFISYLKNRNIFDHLSNEVTKKLISQGYNTHVVFLPHCSFMSYLSKSNIYDYEFRYGKRIYGQIPVFNETALPSFNDALELTFTVISDLIFNNSQKIEKSEQSYILAKRALTLLNSVLIFYQVPLETYKKRIEFAKMCYDKKNFPFNSDEIEVLSLYTEFKLFGSIDNLMKSLGMAEINELLAFQTQFLKMLVLKCLYYELSIYACKSIKKTEFNETNEFYQSNIPSLLDTYSSKSILRAKLRFFGLILLILTLFYRNKLRRDLFVSFLFHKQAPKVILNHLIALYLVSSEGEVTMKFRSIFPWLTYNNVTNLKDNLFLPLWRISERVLKVG
jgi:hypothetical protein